MAVRSSKAQLDPIDPCTSDQANTVVAWAQRLESVGLSPQQGPAVNVINASAVSDAGSAIELVRSQHVVLINCAGIEQRLAQRLSDMINGGITALGGELHCIGPTLLLACPTMSRVHTI